MATDELGLAAKLREWYSGHGISPAEGRRQLESLTGVSRRTFERIEQKRSFKYPGMLEIALDATAKKSRQDNGDDATAPDCSNPRATETRVAVEHLSNAVPNGVG